MRQYLKTGLLLLLLLGCDQTTQPDTSKPYTRWKSYDLHDYTIDQLRSCFCVLGGVTMTVTVRSDTVASVWNAADSSEAPSTISGFYLTVDSLFGIVRNPGADSLVIHYDQTYGYPDTLDINPQQHPVDGGVLYVTSKLRIP